MQSTTAGQPWRASGLFRMRPSRLDASTPCCNNPPHLSTKGARPDTVAEEDFFWNIALWEHIIRTKVTVLADATMLKAGVWRTLFPSFCESAHRLQHPPGHLAGPTTCYPSIPETAKSIILSFGQIARMPDPPRRVAKEMSQGKSSSSQPSSWRQQCPPSSHGSSDLLAHPRVSA